MLKKRLFVDMDGTLAVFKPVSTLETLYEPGYFLNLEPIHNVLEAVKMIAKRQDIEVFILSSVLSDSSYALEEKNAWLDRYLPEIDRQHRFFPTCGSDKKEVIPGGVKGTDYLMDDYTKNLQSWEPPAVGIKLLNGINHTKGSWSGNRISASRNSNLLSEAINSVLDGRMIQDPKIQKRVAVVGSDMKP